MKKVYLNSRNVACGLYRKLINNSKVIDDSVKLYYSINKEQYCVQWQEKSSQILPLTAFERRILA